MSLTTADLSPPSANRRHGFRLSLRELLQPHFAALTIAFLAVAGESAANLLAPWPLKIVLDDVLRGHHNHATVERWLHSFTGSLGILQFACIAVLAIAALDAVSTYVEKYLTTSVGQWVAHDLRRTLYSHIQRLSLAFHDHERTGDLISRVTSDIDAIQSFITQALLGIVVNLLTLVGMIGVMFYLEWRFTLIALSVTPLLFVLIYSYTRRIKKASRAVRKKEGEITSVVEEVLSSIRVVKAFAREDYEVRRLEEESLEGIELALRARSLKAKLSPIVDLIVAGGTCLVLWFGARLVLSGGMSAGVLVVFILYLGKMYKPMQEISKMTDTYSKAAVGYERVRELLETDGQIKDRKGAIPAPKFAGRVDFDRVCFSYVPETPILEDVSFVIEPGQVAALVGPTGAGKTSIISLIARFYEPQSGKVMIDGVDIRRYRQRSLRQQLSFVLQETMLFRAPVWQNIAYGEPKASRSEIIRAAELANASEFIEKLPQGYDTLLGERGMTLSGGQRQRIAIARAVLRETPILIMDEPTSGLDSGSEKLVLEALERLMKNKTSIIIAHRLSTVRDADLILVIQDGHIAERGTHEQLLHAHGLYSRLHSLQFSPEESFM